MAPQRTEIPTTRQNEKSNQTELKHRGRMRGNTTPGSPIICLIEKDPTTRTGREVDETDANLRLEAVSTRSRRLTKLDR
jgi:hypothetical protein